MSKIKTRFLGVLPNSTMNRFKSKIDSGLNPNECWMWRGGLNYRGYGEFGVNGRTASAHRIAYHLIHGEIPQGLLVCHSCDTPACVNPSHLFLGTSKDNIHDAMRKGRLATGDRNGHHTHPECTPRGLQSGRYTKPERTARGDRHGTRTHPETVLKGEEQGRSKLKDNDVRFIREFQGKLKNCELARMFSVSKGLIGHIHQGRNWTHVK